MNRRFDPTATQSMRPRGLLVSLALAVVAGLGGTLSPAIPIPVAKPAPTPEPHGTEPMGWWPRPNHKPQTCAAALKRAAKKRRMARARASKRRKVRT